MPSIGTRIDESGTLLHEGGTFFLRRDLGGRYELELGRTLENSTGERVRVIGTLVGRELVHVDNLAFG